MCGYYGNNWNISYPITRAGPLNGDFGFYRSDSERDEERVYGYQTQ